MLILGKIKGVCVLFGETHCYMFSIPCANHSNRGTGLSNRKGTKSWLPVCMGISHRSRGSSRLLPLFWSCWDLTQGGRGGQSWLQVKWLQTCLGIPPSVCILHKASRLQAPSEGNQVEGSCEVSMSPTCLFKLAHVRAKHCNIHMLLV